MLPLDVAFECCQGLAPEAAGGAVPRTFPCVLSLVHQQRRGILEHHPAHGASEGLLGPPASLIGLDREKEGMLLWRT